MTFEIHYTKQTDTILENIKEKSMNTIENPQFYNPLYDVFFNFNE